MALHVSFWIAPFHQARRALSLLAPCLNLIEEGFIWLKPESVLDTKEHKLQKHRIREELIQWKDMQPEDATWKLVAILQQFPHLQR
jgi:hypothetical protein